MQDKDNYGNVVSNSNVLAKVQMVPNLSMQFKAQGKGRQGSWIGSSGPFDIELKLAVSNNPQEGMKLLVAAASTKVQMNAKVAANGQYIGILKSNIPGFEQLEGKAMLKTNTPTEKTILFAASKNKVNLFKGRDNL